MARTATHALKPRITKKPPTPRVPTWVLGVASAILALNVGLMVAGGIVGGVTLDEPAHVHRLEGFLEHGWYVSKNHVSDGKVTQEGGYVYAPTVALVGHAMNVVTGIEEWDTVSETPAAYVVRHLALAGFGLLGLIAVAATVRLLTWSWRWGVLAAATLSSIPVYMGHAMFNIKDLPVAAGYAAVTLGAVALTRPMITQPRMRWLAAGSLAFGIWIAAGVHPAMLVSIGMSILVALAVCFVRMRKKGKGKKVDRERMIARLVVAGQGVLAGYAALILTYPKLFLRPDLLVESVLKSGDFPWSGYTLTAGEFLKAGDSTSLYLPMWFAAQTPVIFSCLIIGVMVWFMRGALSPPARRPGDANLMAGVAVVLVQATFLPWVAITLNSTLYQGARQMLFVVPAMAVLATVGAWLVVRWAMIARRRTLLRPMFAGLVAVFAITAVSSAALFPYAYTWFNAPTAIRPIDGNWTLDYEWQSSREVMPKISTVDDDQCILMQPNDDCDRSQVAPYANTLGKQLVGKPLSAGETWRLAYGAAVARPDAPSIDHDKGRECKRVATVQRHLFWRTATMTSVERCLRGTQPQAPQ